MKADPFDVVLMNMGYRPMVSLADDSSEDSNLRTYNCRTSQSVHKFSIPTTITICCTIVQLQTSYKTKK